MKKYLALLLAVLLVFSCALPTISADDVQNDTEITENTASEPQVLADPSSEPIPLNSCAHENKEFVEAQEPTCTYPGHISYYHCPDCGSNLDELGNMLETVELPTAPHVPGDVKYQADYTPCGGGYKTDYYYCVNCIISKVDANVPLLTGHLLKQISTHPETRSMKLIIRPAAVGSKRTITSVSIAI